MTFGTDFTGSIEWNLYAANSMSKTNFASKRANSDLEKTLSSFSYPSSSDVLIILEYVSK